MAEEQDGQQCEDLEPNPQLGTGASLAKRQARVTVKYNRKELQRRLNVETWLEDELHQLYAGAEDEMPDEIDIDELLVLQSDEERAVKLQELLHACRTSTQPFIAELLQKLQGLHNQQELQSEGIGHPCLHGYPHHHSNTHQHHHQHHSNQPQQRAHQTL